MTIRRIRGRADLEEYVGAFNAKDYARQISYYAPDVEYRVGTLTLSSPQAIGDFYADFHTYSDEHVRIADFVMEGDTIAVSIPSWFSPFRDYRKHGLEFLAGQERRLVSFAFYRLKDGQIHRIRVARYNGPASDYD